MLNADDNLGKKGQLLSHNMFAYCSNDPINLEGQDGRCAWIIGGAIIGAVVGTISQVTCNIASGNNWYDNVAGAASVGAVAGAIFAATGGTVLIAASFVGAGVTSIVNEAETYVKGKKVTKNNLKNSVKNVVTSTVVNGVVNTSTNMIGGHFIYTNPNWFQPTKIVPSLNGKYAQKVWKQSAIGGAFNTAVSSVFSSESKRNTSIEGGDNSDPMGNQYLLIGNQIDKTIGMESVI